MTILPTSRSIFRLDLGWYRLGRAEARGMPDPNPTLELDERRFRSDTALDRLGNACSRGPSEKLERRTRELEGKASCSIEEDVDIKLAREVGRAGNPVEVRVDDAPRVRGGRIASRGIPEAGIPEAGGTGLVAASRGMREAAGVEVVVELLDVAGGFGVGGGDAGATVSPNCSPAIADISNHIVCTRSHPACTRTSSLTGSAASLTVSREVHVWPSAARSSRSLRVRREAGRDGGFDFAVLEGGRDWVGEGTPPFASSSSSIALSKPDKHSSQ